MIVVNFGHPLTAGQLAAIERLGGQPVSEVRDEPTQSQIDPARPLAEQAAALADAVGLSAAAWQSAAIVVNLPGYAPAAAALLAELHGRMGHFPTIVRLRPAAGGGPTVYEVAELINLQAARDAARRRRAAAEPGMEVF